MVDLEFIGIWLFDVSVADDGLDCVVGVVNHELVKSLVGHLDVVVNVLVRPLAVVGGVQNHRLDLFGGLLEVGSVLILELVGVQLGLILRLLILLLLDVAQRCHLILFFPRSVRRRFTTASAAILLLNVLMSLLVGGVVGALVVVAALVGLRRF